MKRLRSRRLWPTRLQNSRYSNHLMGAPYIGAPISFNLRCSPGRHSGAAPHVVILAQPHTSSFWRSPTRRHSGAAPMRVVILAQPESPYWPLPLPVLALALVCSRPCPCLFSPLPLSVLALAVVSSRPCRCLFSGGSRGLHRLRKNPFFVFRREQGASAP